MDILTLATYSAKEDRDLLLQHMPEVTEDTVETVIDGGSPVGSPASIQYLNPLLFH